MGGYWSSSAIPVATTLEKLREQTNANTSYMIIGIKFNISNKLEEFVLSSRPRDIINEYREYREGSIDFIHKRFGISLDKGFTINYVYVLHDGESDLSDDIVPYAM